MCFPGTGCIPGRLAIILNLRLCLHDLEPARHRRLTQEEISIRNSWIYKESLVKAAAQYGKSPYGKHLREVAEGRVGEPL